MESFNEKLNLAKKHIEKAIGKTPISIGIVFGSGLSGMEGMIENPVTFRTEEIPYFPPSTVIGHEGRVVFGNIGPASVMVLRGRVHHYEGYSMGDVTFSTHLAATMGVKILIVTNAAGGINSTYRAGDLILIIDHLNFFFQNSFCNISETNQESRYRKRAEYYDTELGRIANDSAIYNGFSLKRGVLAGGTGPSYETKSEIQMFRKIGADCVSMSMIPEVLVASHHGLRVLGISCITNMATGIAPSTLSHQEVTRVANRTQGRLSQLLVHVVHQLSNGVLN